MVGGDSGGREGGIERVSNLQNADDKTSSRSPATGGTPETGHPRRLCMKARPIHGQIQTVRSLFIWLDRTPRAPLIRMRSVVQVHVGPSPVSALCYKGIRSVTGGAGLPRTC